MAFVAQRPEVELSEAAIQNELARILLFEKSHAAVVPNTYLYGFETDLVSVTRAGFVYGFEIKISRSDFASEFIGECRSKKKTLRLAMLRKEHEFPARVYMDGRHSLFDIPSYFSIVVPDGILERSEIPAEFGIYRYSARGKIDQVRRPRILHRRRITSEEAARLAHSFASRYWKERFAK